ncbi:PucR family transcriptional regulator [Saccharopolyspora sp. NPDC050389]|uniref:PucR family transcriptional regulator n=1 Tax=Saccharopolyspora sp. NPDC050389 TaxID=3155516 RepID=UPI0033C702C2
MSVTVGDLLGVAELKLRCIAGAAGLSNVVRWVHVSEVEDPTPWLSGGEFLLTTLFVRRPDADPERVFDAFARTGVAGIGCGVNDQNPHVPDRWAELAEARGIPLLVVPLKTPYIAISEYVASARIEAEHRRLRTLMVAETALADLSLTEDTCEPLVHELARRLRCGAAVVDRSRTTLAASGPGAANFVNEFAETFERFQSGSDPASGSIRESDRDVVVNRGPGADAPTLLVVRDTRFDDQERLLLASTASLLALQLSRNHVLREPERHLRTASLQAITDPRTSEETRHLLLAALGIEQSNSIRVVLAKVDAPPSLAEVETFERCSHDAGWSARAWSTDSTIGALLVRRPETDPTTRVQPAALSAALQAWLESCRSSTATTRIGISRTARSVQVLALHDEATGLATLASQLRRTVIAAGDLPLESVVPAALPPETMRYLRAATWDRLTDVALKHALEAYLDANGVVDIAARALAVHRQTLRRRVHSAGELLGLDLDSANVRALLTVTRGVDQL